MMWNPTQHMVQEPWRKCNSTRQFRRMG